jgi:hypothetical protein
VFRGADLGSGRAWVLRDRACSTPAWPGRGGARGGAEGRGGGAARQREGAVRGRRRVADGCHPPALPAGLARRLGPRPVRHSRGLYLFSSVSVWVWLASRGPSPAGGSHGEREGKQPPPPHGWPISPLSLSPFAAHTASRGLSLPPPFPKLTRRRQGRAPHGGREAEEGRHAWCGAREFARKNEWEGGLPSTRPSFSLSCPWLSPL